jgi:hypothetical protein
MLLIVMWVCHGVARTDTYSSIARYLIAMRPTKANLFSLHGPHDGANAFFNAALAAPPLVQRDLHRASRGSRLS